MQTGDYVSVLSHGLLISATESVAASEERRGGGLFHSEVYVLEPDYDPTQNMDRKRTYRRRTDKDTGKREILKCRISQLSSNDLVLAMLRGSEMTHRVYFQTQPNLREDNRIEYRGIQYILLGAPMNASQLNRLWTIDVKMVTQQNETVEIIE